MFCKHDWEVIVNEKTKSALEVMYDNDKVLSDEKVSYEAMCRLTKYTHIHILKCKKCGKLKKFETYNQPY